jgi:raffinose/stachyose/melibiose transport system permease protein
MHRYTWRTGALEAFLIVAALITLVPIIGLINVAFKAPANTSTALQFSGPYTLANFSEAWIEGLLGAALLNSTVITVASVATLVVIGSMVSYLVARRTERWNKGLFMLFLLGLVVPGQLSLLPMYQTMVDLQLVGTIPGIVLINVGAGLPFTVFLFTTFLRDLPRDYEEAAMIDGAGPVRMFALVVFPLLRPIVGTVVILNAIATWNSFFVPLLYLAGTGLETVPVRLYGFVGQYTSNWPVIFAGLIITILPVLVAFFFLQRSVMQGFSGGVKG